MENKLSIVDLKAGDSTSEKLVGSIAAVEAASDSSIPAGYVKINLSTRGCIGAPAEFHIRNFNTRDIMELALTEEEELPGRIMELLADLIFEDVDVKSFHEAEVIETLVVLFKAFFKPVLEDVEFPWDDSDLEALERLYPDAAEEKKNALLKGLWKPTTDIDLSTVETYDIAEDFNPVARIQHKSSGFSCSFGLPRYGDVLVLKQWLRDNFEEKEKAFAKTAQLLKIREAMLERFEAGEDIDLARLPTIDEEQEAAYQKLQVRKTAALIDVIRGLHLKSFDGKDVSSSPLSERIRLVQDPRVDVKVAKKLDNYFNKLEFGVKPEVTMKNPITGDFCTRRFSFRLIEILQAIQICSADEYDLVFDS